jgi:hypothetical protein
VRPDVPATLRPPIQWLILVTPVWPAAGGVASSVMCEASLSQPA